MKNQTSPLMLFFRRKLKITSTAAGKSFSDDEKIRSCFKKQECIMLPVQKKPGRNIRPGFFYD